MLSKRVLLSVLLGAGCGVFSVMPALAQVYPTRPIKIVNPFPAGGAGESALRFLADRLQMALGKAVVIENRPGGAAGTVGAKSVASADPDGYTLLASSPGPLVTAPSLYKNLGYDPVKSFTPIAMTYSSPQVLTVHSAIPVATLQELVAYARAHPGRLNFASPGFGTQPHLLGEMLRLRTGINIVHVPYRGPAPAVTDLLAGQAQMYFESILLLPHIEAGKLRALAVADDTRCAQLPGVPTTVESGFPYLLSSLWGGILAPAGTPSSIVDKLNMAINEILQSEEMVASLAKLSARPKIGSPQDFARHMAAETKKWSEVITAAGIKAE